MFDDMKKYLGQMYIVYLFLTNFVVFPMSCNYSTAQNYIYEQCNEALLRLHNL